MYLHSICHVTSTNRALVSKKCTSAFSDHKNVETTFQNKRAPLKQTSSRTRGVAVGLEDGPTIPLILD